jgi:hypothetical protein
MLQEMLVHQTLFNKEDAPRANTMTLRLEGVYQMIPHQNLISVRQDSIVLFQEQAKQVYVMLQEMLVLQTPFQNQLIHKEDSKEVVDIL